MKLSKFAYILIAVISLALAMPQGALGKGKPKPKPANTNNNNNNPTDTTPPPPVDRSASVKARADVAAAQAALNKATTTLESVAAKLRNDFEQTSTCQDARAGVKTAQAALDAARKPIIDALLQKPEYTAAKAAKEKAEAALKALPPDADTDTRQKLGMDLMAANTELNKIEGAALAVDPNVQDARAKLVTANNKVAEVLAQFEASLPSNPEYLAAKRDQDAKKAALAAANLALSQALAREADAERQRQQKIAEQNQNQQNNQNNKNNAKKNTNNNNNN